MANRGYRYAISWIALNDETADMDVESVSDNISVLLIADLFNKDPMEVAKKVIAFRTKSEKTENPHH